MPTVKQKTEVTAEMRGQGVPFVRNRRVTGYMATLDKFGDSKLAEYKDRRPHIWHISGGMNSTRMREELQLKEFFFYLVNEVYVDLLKQIKHEKYRK